MATYVVRNRETKAVLGLVAAPTLADLWNSVDEVADPCLYEWARITHGGLLFPRQEYGPFDDDHPSEPLDVSADDHLSMFLIEKRRKWTALDRADEGEGMIARHVRAAGLDPQAPATRARVRSAAHVLQLRVAED